MWLIGVTLFSHHRCRLAQSYVRSTLLGWQPAMHGSPRQKSIGFTSLLETEPTKRALIMRILFASAQIEPVFGIEPHKHLGERIESLMPERFRTGHTSFLKACFSAPNPPY